MTTSLKVGLAKTTPLKAGLPRGMASKRFLRIKKFLNSSPERIYLCNWYVYLVKPGKELPGNQVQCHVPMRCVNK